MIRPEDCGVGEFTKSVEKDQEIFLVGEKAFLVCHKNTIEVRTDAKLKDVLIERYESVMESRYFGRGGIEVVLSGQLKEDEVRDLVRLSYDLTAQHHTSGEGDEDLRGLL